MSWVKAGLSATGKALGKIGINKQWVSDTGKIGAGMALAGFIEAQFEAGGRITAKHLQEFMTANGRRSNVRRYRTLLFIYFRN